MRSRVAGCHFLDWGRTLSDEEIMAAFGQSEERTIRGLAPNGFEDCLKKFLKHYESMPDAYAVPFEGIASLLDKLRSARVPVAVVTGKGRAAPPSH